MNNPFNLAYNNLINGFAAVKYLVQRYMNSAVSRSGKGGAPQWLFVVGLVLLQAVPGSVPERQATREPGAVAAIRS